MWRLCSSLRMDFFFIITLNFSQCDICKRKSYWNLAECYCPKIQVIFFLRVKNSQSNGDVSTVKKFNQVAGYSLCHTKKTCVKVPKIIDCVFFVFLLDDKLNTLLFIKTFDVKFAKLNCLRNSFFNLVKKTQIKNVNTTNPSVIHSVLYCFPKLHIV